MIGMIQETKRHTGGQQDLTSFQRLIIFASQNLAVWYVKWPWNGLYFSCTFQWSFINFKRNSWLSLISPSSDTSYVYKRWSKMKLQKDISHFFSPSYIPLQVDEMALLSNRENWSRCRELWDVGKPSWAMLAKYDCRRIRKLPAKIWEWYFE